MAENKCDHWYTKTTEDESKTRYCRDCFVILDEVPYWAGTIKVGMLIANLGEDIESPAFNIGDTISMYVGVPVTLTSVTLTGEQYNYINYMVGFSVGGKQMYADLTDIRRASKRVPSGKFYTEPVVPEATESVA